MSIFSKITDALLRLVGLRKDPPKPPHQHYYSHSQPGYGFEGYWASNTVTLRAVGTGFDVALSRVAQELNRGAKEAGLPYTFAVTTAPGETVLVQFDMSGKVQRGNTGRTPPEEMTGLYPNMPQAQAHCVVYVKRGVSGDSLYRLLLHEIFCHGGKLEHSGDSRDAGHPDCKADKLSPADLVTWKYATERRRRDGIEPVV